MSGNPRSGARLKIRTLAVLQLHDGHGAVSAHLVAGSILGIERHFRARRVMHGGDTARQSQITHNLFALAIEVHVGVMDNLAPAKRKDRAGLAYRGTGPGRLALPLLRLTPDAQVIAFLYAIEAFLPHEVRGLAGERLPGNGHMRIVS